MNKAKGMSIKMIDYIYKTLFSLSKKGKGNTKYFSYYRKVAKLIINLIYPIYFKLSKRKDYGIDEKSDNNVIVTLTSFPGRINYVWLSIETLLRQETKPNMIILWLAKNQFSGLDELPNNLKRLQKRGLTIRFCDDLKSHKKYYYTMKENPNANVIIVDDDMYYPRNLVSKLIETSNNNPNTICCNRGHYMKYSEGKIMPYSEWVRERDTPEASYDLCPTGCGGVLYPPNTLSEEVFNKESIQNLCLNADDLWLKVMSLKRDTKAIKTNPYMIDFIDIISTQNIKLTTMNVGKNMNDIQLEKILNKYKIDFESIFELEREENP